MKFSVSVGGSSVPLPMIMFRENLDQSLRTVAEIGYDGVELMLHSAESEEAKGIKRLLDKYRLSVGMLVAVPYLVQEDVILGHPDKAVRRQFIERSHAHLKLAGELGAVVPIGFTHGFIRPGTRREDVEGWFFDALPEYIRLAENYGVTLVLEPINRYEVNYINTVDEALKVLDAFPAENLKLLLDIFHMNIEEKSIVGAIRKAGDRIGHVHFVDSNRWPPGYGHLDLKEIYRQLVAVGYRGYIGLEALPEPDPETGARNGLGYVKSLQSIYG